MFKHFLKRIFIAFIRFYQRFISPLSGPRCRFYPTCSQYALEAVQLHGGLKGGWLGVKRVCRCHPWGGSGVDFVPLPIPKFKHCKFYPLDQTLKSEASTAKNNFWHIPYR